MKKTILVLMLTVSWVAGCSSSSSSGPEGFTATAPFSLTQCDAPDPGKGNIIGQVHDSWSTVLSGKSAVTFGKVTGDVDGYGRFYLCNVPAGESLAVTVNLPRTFAWDWFSGYAPVTKTLTLGDGEERFLNFRLKMGNFSQVDADAVASGTAVGDGTTDITFPANAVAKSDGSPFSGPLNVQISSFNAADPEDLESFPGDFAGVDAGAEVGLFSLGFVDVQIFDNDENPLQLAEGKIATLSFPVQNLLPSDTTIPMWYFDEAQGTWIRDGEGTVDQTTGRITAEVSHFTFWNADKPVTLTDCITGVAQNGDGSPLAGAMVYGSGQGYGHADDSGNFCVNFYPKATFEVRGNFYDAGVLYQAVKPYVSYTGSREGGQSCLDPTTCLPLAAPVVFEGSEASTRCLNVTLQNATTNHKSGTLTISDSVNAVTVYNGSMNGSASACIELPASGEFNINLNAMTGNVEAFCGISSFNGEPLAAETWSITLGDIPTSCQEGGCDEVILTCEEFSGHGFD